MNVSLLDILFAAIVVFFLVHGVIRGFISEILSKASVILGIAAAVFFSGPLFSLLSPHLGESIWVQILSFVLLFGVVFLLIRVLEGLMQKGMERLNLQRWDRLLGFFVGALEGFLMVAVILFLLQVQPFFDLESLLSRSLFARFILPLLKSTRIGLVVPQSI